MPLDAVAKTFYRDAPAGAWASKPEGEVPVNSVAPFVAGTTALGFSLSCSTGTWSNSPTSYARQWLRDGSNIGGATSSTYELIEDDVGTDISCRVTASNASGAGTPAVSNEVGPVAEEAPNTKLGANIALPDYFSMQDLHVNIVHDASHSAIPWQDDAANYIDPETGWIVGLPPGGRARLLIKLNLSASKSAAMRQGAWKVRSNSGGTCGVIAWQGGVINDVPGVNVCTFDVDSGEGFPEFSAYVDNDTASPIDLDPELGLQVYFAANEALLDADPLAFDPIPLADMAPIVVLRDASLTGSLGELQITPSTRPTMDTWIEMYWPAAHFAKLAKQVGCQMHITMPCVMDVLLYSCDAATNTFTTTDIYNNPVVAPWSNGDQVCLLLDNTALTPGSTIPTGAPLFVRNFSAGTFQLSLTAEGSILDVETDINASAPDRYNYFISKIYDFATVYEEIASEHFAVYPECENVRSGGLNEPWNTGGNFFRHFAWCAGIGNYLATGVNGSGNSAGIAQAYVSLHAWKAYEDLYGREHVTRVFEAQIFHGTMSYGLDYVDPGIIDEGAPFYELVDEVAVGLYVLPCTDEFQPEYGSYRAYTLAELISEGAKDWTDEQWHATMARSIDDNVTLLEGWRTQIDARRPAIKLTTYECGQHFWFNNNAEFAIGSEQDLLIQRWRTFWYGPGGAATRALYKSELFDAFNVQVMSQFTFAGQWLQAPAYYLQSWGGTEFYGEDYYNDYRDFLLTFETAT